MSELHEHVARLAELAPKVLHETERLRRDVARLHMRIEAIDPEAPLSKAPEFAPPRTRWPVRDALNMFQQARDLILACEQHLSAIRGRMDMIESSATSREEWKRYLKE